MTDIKRVSPVVFKAAPLKKETRDHWEVVFEYDKEAQGPWIIDLSHIPRYDCQHNDLKTITPFGMALPQVPGDSRLEKGILANRMNRTQVSLFNLAGDKTMPDDPVYTDVTEATLCLALIGKQIFEICEKLTALDFADPAKNVPFLYQGPFCHVPCQIVTLGREHGNEGIVLTCSRGYGRDMVHAILAAGRAFGLRPAGELKFTKWLENLN